MTSSERSTKTWILLDPTCEFNIDEAEVDTLGASVLWGCQDSDSSSPLRSKVLLDWCSDLVKRCEPHFKKFT